MEKDLLVQAKDVTKIYRLYRSPGDRVKEAFHPFRKRYHHPFVALNNISLDVHRGEAIGIIGRNGSGKSTLLQIVSRILKPTSGNVELKGRVSALLELGTGFNPNLTGRDNIFINGAILGLSKKEINARFKEIVDFADIGEFIEQPVKFYSSGMFVRLAFAVQACVDPDVLIVDEALSVGDIFFQQKCHARMNELLAHRTAVILVSHDMNAIAKYSTKTMLLEQGDCLFFGQPNEAIQRYYHISERYRPDHKTDLTSTGEPSDPSVLDPEFSPDLINDWPSRDAFLDLSNAVFVGEEDVARCTEIALCNAAGRPCSSFEIGETAVFYYEFELLDQIGMPVGGVTLTDRFNVNVHGKNSLQYFYKASPYVQKGKRVRFRQTMDLSIAYGEYSFTVGLATLMGTECLTSTRLDDRSQERKLKTIMRVRRAGSIVVRERAKGLHPFHGYADLGGNIQIAVL